ESRGNVCVQGRSFRRNNQSKSSQHSRGEGPCNFPKERCRVLKFGEVINTVEFDLLILVIDDERSFRGSGANLPNGWPQTQAQIELLSLVVTTQSEMSVETKAF